MQKLPCLDSDLEMPMPCRTGIEMNFLLWDVPADKASLFLSTEPEATLNGSDENKFRQISTQAWIAFVPNFTEAWCNIRRTGYQRSRRGQTPICMPLV